MRSRPPTGISRRSTERTRQLALMLFVLLVPTATLYAQIIGDGTTLFTMLYGAVTVLIYQLGRLMPDAELAELPEEG